MTTVAAAVLVAAFAGIAVMAGLVVARLYRGGDEQGASSSSTGTG